MANELIRIRAPLRFKLAVRLSARKFFNEFLHFRNLLITIRNVFEKLKNTELGLWKENTRNM